MIQIKDIKDMVSKYKTISAQKAFLTREIKAFREYYMDLKNAYEKRQGGYIYGWYLGKKIYRRDVENSKMELEILEKYKSQNYG